MDGTLLNLLYRLKFSIRANAVLIILLILLGKPLWLNAIDSDMGMQVSNGKTRMKITRELPTYIRFSGPTSYVNTQIQNNDIAQRMLRNEESNIYRNEFMRWRKIHLGNDQLERRIKRDTIMNVTTNMMEESSTQSSSTLSSISRSPLKKYPLSSNKMNTNPMISTNYLNFSRNGKLHAILTFSDLHKILLNQQISQNISDLIVINFSQNNLTAIDENLLESFPNVKYLDVSENKMTAFDVNKTHQHLEWLNLSNNRIRLLNAESLTKLKYLDLSCNDISNITHVHINGLKYLEYLDLSGNQFDEFNGELLENSNNLKTMHLIGNRFEKIYKDYFRHLINMEVLNLSNNNIRIIENYTFTYLQNLQYLDLSYNQLDASSIRALQGIPDLIQLSLAFNVNLGSALQGFVSSWSLKHLDASGTGLCEIPSALAQSVHTLNISHNTFPVSNAKKNSIVSIM